MDNISKQLITLCAKSGFSGLSFRFVLLQCLYMEVRDEKNWEDVREVARCAPLMTDKQSKILALLVRLHEMGIPLSENEKNKIDIIEELLRFIRYSIFGKDSSGQPRMKTFKIFQLANLTRMFMALVRFKGKRLFSFKCILNYHLIFNSFCTYSLILYISR